MRQITTHHDGHSLAERIRIEADESGPGGASHYYVCRVVDSNVERVTQVAELQFQKGPRDDPNSTPGVIDGVLLAIVRDRLEAFNAGDFRCRENAIAITKIQEAMFWLKERADDRARRNVLGTYGK